MTLEEKRLKARDLTRAYRKKYPERVKATAKKAWLKYQKRVDPVVMRQTRRKWHLKIQYGVSLEQYDQMLVAQNGVCAVCFQPETGIRRGSFKSLDVDHNHATGAIRGLLCSACNASLGLLKEDPLRIRSLINYIEHYNAK